MVARNGRFGLKRLGPTISWMLVDFDDPGDGEIGPFCQNLAEELGCCSPGASLAEVEN